MPSHDGSVLSNSQFQSRRRVARAFKMRGLAVQASALDAMMNHMKRETQNPHEALNNILDEVKERMMGGNFDSHQLVVTERLLSEVVADLSRDGGDVTNEAVQILDAFQTPRISYNAMRKQFTLMKSSMEDRSLHADAIHKVNMFSQRYALVHQRIMRQDLFRPKLVTAEGRHADEGGATHSLTPIESLLGRSGPKFLLGMIVQVEEGRYYLEDNTAQVPIDLTEAEVLTDGFITENCIVLVEGEMSDGILQVQRMGNPIIESRQDAVDAIGLQNSDLFNSISSLAELEKVRDQEVRNGQEGEFVILSDVHLDNPAVIEKLDKMFDGYQDLSPLPIFVFMGNFVSKPRGGSKMITSCFEELANVISKYKAVAREGRFIFVPGPNDPGIASIMPRPPIPDFFTSVLRAKVPHANFVTNPCRIQYFSKEIVFCRQDLVSKMRRSCLMAPRDDLDDGRNGEERLIQHAIKTVLDQGHLCPLPQVSCPVYWQYDHSLRLYPLPDTLVMGDRVKQYYESYAQCDAINPGTFSKDFSFVLYRPIGEIGSGGDIKSDVEFSQIG